MSSPRSPTGNSIAERIISHVTLGMRIYLKQDIKRILERVENRITNLFNRNLGCTPVELIYNLHPYNIHKISYPIQKGIRNPKTEKIKRNVKH